jgi:hypothetical protein
VKPRANLLAAQAIEYAPVCVDTLREELRHLHAGTATGYAGSGGRPWGASWGVSLESAPSARGAGREIEELLPETCRWFDRLPDYLSPEFTAIEHASIANRLAWLWPEPLAAMRYLDGLILDQGTGQRTFSMDVLFELVALKAWLDEMQASAAGSAFGLPRTLRSAGRTWPGDLR